MVVRPCHQGRSRYRATYAILFLPLLHMEHGTITLVERGEGLSMDFETAIIKYCVMKLQAVPDEYRKSYEASSMVAPGLLGYDILKIERYGMDPSTGRAHRAQSGWKRVAFHAPSVRLGSDTRAG